jgi:hypothetical protein
MGGHRVRDSSDYRWLGYFGRLFLEEGIVYGWDMRNPNPGQIEFQVYRHLSQKEFFFPGCAEIAQFKRYINAQMLGNEI